jgi:hypothetical protein
MGADLGTLLASGVQRLFEDTLSVNWMKIDIMTWEGVKKLRTSRCERHEGNVSFYFTLLSHIILYDITLSSHLRLPIRAPSQLAHLQRAPIRRRGRWLHRIQTHPVLRQVVRRV